MTEGGEGWKSGLDGEVATVVAGVAFRPFVRMGSGEHLLPLRTKLQITNERTNGHSASEVWVCEWGVTTRRVCAPAGVDKKLAKDTKSVTGPTSEIYTVMQKK